jgi:hypothetical protein
MQIRRNPQFVIPAVTAFRIAVTTFCIATQSSVLLAVCIPGTMSMYIGNEETNAMGASQQVLTLHSSVNVLVL